MPSIESRVGALEEGAKNANHRIQEIKDADLIRDKRIADEGVVRDKRIKRLEDWRTWLLGIASALGVIFGLFAKKIMKTLGF